MARRDELLADGMIDPAMKLDRTVPDGNMVSEGIEKFIRSRVRKREIEDPDKRSWAERHSAELLELSKDLDRQRREANRLAWHRHHSEMADRWRRTIEEQVAFHEREAARYASMSIGA